MKGVSTGTIVGAVITLAVLLGLGLIYSIFTETTKEATDIPALKESANILGKEGEIIYTSPTIDPVTIDSLQHIVTTGDRFHSCEIACNVGNHIFEDFKDYGIDERTTNPITITDAPGSKGRQDYTYHLIKSGKFVLQDTIPSADDLEYLENEFSRYGCHMCNESDAIINYLDEIAVNLQLTHESKKIDDADFCGTFYSGYDYVSFEGVADVDPYCKVASIKIPETTRELWNFHCNETEPNFLKYIYTF